MDKRERVAFVLRGLPGLGHVSPAFAIAEELSARNIETHFITYANGIAFLKKKRQAHIHGISTPQHQKGIVPWKDVFEVATEIMPLIKKIKPGIVVVDGEFDSFFLLNKTDAKVVMLTTKPYVDHNFGKYTRYSAISEAIMPDVNMIIVHGLDRPTTKHDNMVFVGPLVRKNFGDPHVAANTVPICTGLKTNMQLASFVKRLEKALRNEHLVPFLVGRNGVGAMFVKEPLEYFCDAPFIATHGGMATIEEAAVLGKPLMLLCDDDQEKRLNALSAKHKGLGLTLDIRDAPDGNSIRCMIKSLMAPSRKKKHLINGTQKAVDAILACGTA